MQYYFGPQASEDDLARGSPYDICAALGNHAGVRRVVGCDETFLNGMTDESIPLAPVTTTP